MQQHCRKSRKFFMPQVVILALILLSTSLPTVHASEGETRQTSAHHISMALASNHDPFHVWSQSFGGPGEERGNSAAVDSMGNVFITGEFWRDIDFGGGLLKSRERGDIFLAKFDPSGNHLWSKRFGAEWYDGGKQVAVDSDGNVLITGFASDLVDFGGGAIGSGGITENVFLAKFDPDGNHLWSTSFGGNGYDHGNDLAVDSLGNVYILGFFYERIILGSNWYSTSGLEDIFLAKFDKNGNHAWSKSFGSTQSDAGNAVTVDSNGDVLITGYFHEAVDFGGGPLTSAGNADIFLAKFKPDGAYVWSKNFGGVKTDEAADLVSDTVGNTYLTGYLDHSPGASEGNAFLRKVGSLGEPVWTMNFIGSGFEFGTSISLDFEDNIFLLGNFNQTINLDGATFATTGEDFDLFLVKMDADGNPLFSEQYGGSWHDYGKAVASDSEGGLYMIGKIGSSINFGGGDLGGETQHDIFFVKFLPSFVLHLPLVLQ